MECSCSVFATGFIAAVYILMCYMAYSLAVSYIDRHFGKNRESNSSRVDSEEVVPHPIQSKEKNGNNVKNGSNVKNVAAAMQTMVETLSGTLKKPSPATKMTTKEPTKTRADIITFTNEECEEADNSGGASGTEEEGTE